LAPFCGIFHFYQGQTLKVSRETCDSDEAGNSIANESDPQRQEVRSAMKLEAYIEFLLEYNEKVNLVSKKSTRESIEVLASESLLLGQHVSATRIIDAGSGGGLIGLPLAMAFPRKAVVLVETIRKKTKFLRIAAKELALKNVEVWEGSIQECMHVEGGRAGAIVSRGFPQIEILAEYVFREKVREMAVITARQKAEKIEITMANVLKTSYNVPSRDNLIIFKLENVSRET
jgi:16S rRNA (guanine527-N7)-methyltransferase